jgi:hypothetical protein
MKSHRQKKRSVGLNAQNPRASSASGVCGRSRGGLEPAIVEPGDSAQGLVLLLAIASVAHGLKIADVMVRFAVARGNDVVYCPVSAVEMFSA